MNKSKDDLKPVDRKRVHLDAGQIACDRKWVRWALLAITLVVSVPLLIYYNMEGSYVAYQLKRLQSVDYGEIFLLLPQLLVRGGMPVDVAYKGVLLGTNLLTAMIAYACFGAMFGDSVTGLVGSMLYTWCPYRIQLLYVTGELQEAIALCFLPIVLYGLYQILTRDTKECGYGTLWILPTLGLGCLMQSSLLTFLLASGLFLLICILCIKRTLRPKTVLVLGATVLTTALLNGWMWVPLLQYLGAEAFISTNTAGMLLQTKGLSLVHYLWTFFRNGDNRQFGETGLQGAAPIGVGFPVTVLVFVYLWLLFTGKGRRRNDNAPIFEYSKALSIAGGILMLLSMSFFPWDSLRRMNKVFFWLIGCLGSPAKLVAMVGTCFTVTSCMAVWLIRKQEQNQIGRAVCVSVTALCLALTQFLTGDILSKRIPLTEDAAVVADPSVLDLGKYGMSASFGSTMTYGLEAVSVVISVILFIIWMRRQNRVEKI